MMINSDSLLKRFCSECFYADSCEQLGKSEECDIYQNIQAEVESQEETNKEISYGEDW